MENVLFDLSEKLLALIIIDNIQKNLLSYLYFSLFLDNATIKFSYQYLGVRIL